MVCVVLTVGMRSTFNKVLKGLKHHVETGELIGNDGFDPSGIGWEAEALGPDTSSCRPSRSNMAIADPNCWTN